MSSTLCLQNHIVVNDNFAHVDQNNVSSDADVFNIFDADTLKILKHYYIEHTHHYVDFFFNTPQLETQICALDDKFRDYVMGSTPLEPPSWIFFEQSKLVITTLALEISNKVTNYWTEPKKTLTNTNNVIAKITMCKSHACSGATTLARSICYLQSTKALIIWISKLPQDNIEYDIIANINTLIGVYPLKNIVVATDEHISTKNIEFILKSLKTTPENKLLWLNVVSCSEDFEDSYNNIIYVPHVVANTDMDKFVEKLSVLGCRSTLLETQKRAALAKTDSIDKSLLTFVLSATHNMDTSLEKWVRMMVLQIDEKDKIWTAVRIAFLCAFNHNRTTCAIYYSKCNEYFIERSKLNWVSTCFWSLFTPVYGFGESHITCVAPYVAKLILKYIVDLNLIEFNAVSYNFNSIFNNICKDTLQYVTNSNIEYTKYRHLVNINNDTCNTINHHLHFSNFIRYIIFHYICLEEYTSVKSKILGENTHINIVENTVENTVENAVENTTINTEINTQRVINNIINILSLIRKNIPNTVYMLTIARIIVYILTHQRKREHISISTFEQNLLQAAEYINATKLLLNANDNVVQNQNSVMDINYSQQDSILYKFGSIEEDDNEDNIYVANIYHGIIHGMLSKHYYTITTPNDYSGYSEETLCHDAFKLLYSSDLMKQQKYHDTKSNIIRLAKKYLRTKSFIDFWNNEEILLEIQDKNNTKYILYEDIYF